MSSTQSHTCFSNGWLLLILMQLFIHFGTLVSTHRNDQIHIRVTTPTLRSRLTDQTPKIRTCHLTVNPELPSIFKTRPSFWHVKIIYIYMYLQLYTFTRSPIPGKLMELCHCPLWELFGNEDGSHSWSALQTFFTSSLKYVVSNCLDPQNIS